MKISYNWLNDYLDLELSAEELAEKLTLHGLEVDAVEQIGTSFEHVVIGEIKDVREHPNADRLQLCDVNIGASTVQIVCGAPNVSAGQKVPVATVGAELPPPEKSDEPFRIRKAKMRGEVSEGMICAEDELGIGTDHSGILVLDDHYEPGQPFTDAHPATEDAILDIELTPNRPDAACHLGVARDVAAFTGKNLIQPDIPDQGKLKKELSKDHIDIAIENSQKCHRYVGLVIKDAEINESPAWLKTKLQAIDIRPVNNVVDATNFVLHEMGQPLHAFDYDLLADKKIVVKDFQKSIAFETLDHVKREVPAGALFICDGQQPVAIAGIMGGIDSEINDNTTNILLESAYFDPGSIRRTAKQLGLQTDASYRFERGIDPNMTKKAAYRCAQLITELTGGTLIEGVADIHPVITEPIELPLRIAYVNRLLGTQFNASDVAGYLEKLEFTILKKNQEKLLVEVPTFRPDVEREVDLIEEVGRIYDYNNITMPDQFCISEIKPLPIQETLQQEIKEVAKSQGFKEIYTNSLLSEDDALRFAESTDLVHTLNPMSKDQAVLRTSLLHGFLKAVSYNGKRGAEQLRFFECGHVFRHADNGTYFEGYKEDIHFSVGLAGLKTQDNWKTDSKSVDLFDLKSHITAMLEQLHVAHLVDTHLTADNNLIFTWQDADGKKVEVGNITALDHDTLKSYDIDVELPVYYAEFSFDVIKDIRKSSASESDGSQFEPVPKYPVFEFDLALVVDKSVPAGTLMNTISKTAGENLHDLKVFDLFEGESIGEDNKSIAFTLTFLDRSKTLTINDVQPIINDVLKKLKKECGAELRSR